MATICSGPSASARNAAPRQEQAERAGRSRAGAELGVGQDAHRVAQVGLDDGRAWVAVQEEACCGRPPRRPCLRRARGAGSNALGDLVDVVLVGMPEPMSRNWRMPASTAGNAQPGQEGAVRPCDGPGLGSTTIIARASVLVSAEIWFPPSHQSWTRATLALPVSMPRRHPARLHRHCSMVDRRSTVPLECFCPGSSVPWQSAGYILGVIGNRATR